VGDADDAHARVALGIAVGRQLFQVRAVVLGGDGRVVHGQSGLLGQFARRGLGQVLVVPYEAAGERPPPLEGGFAPAHRQRAQGMPAHGQHDQVHGHGEGRKG
jgi:hypothetical protein